MANKDVTAHVDSRYEGRLPAPEESDIDDWTERVDKLEDKRLEDEPLLETFVCFRHFWKQHKL